MNKLIRIDIDEPESCVLMSPSNKEHYQSMLPRLIDDIVFCVFNNIFENGRSAPLDINKMALVISSRALIMSLSKGLPLNYRLPNSLVRPFEEVVLHLVPAILPLSKYSELIDIHIHCHQIKIIIQEIH